MLDIIIPTYKNKEKLRKTLSSINQSLLSQYTVTVVDDCSGFDSYDDIIADFPFVHMLYQKQNSGPGNSRQLGIDNTSEPYIMFIDTGDYFVNDELQVSMLETIKAYPKAVVISWQYYMGNEIAPPTNNRLHARAYQRELFDVFNISFCKESSFTNEDIGVNRLVRLLIYDFKLQAISIDEMLIMCDNNSESITHKNKGEFFYKQQNMGLALNVIHEVEIAKKHQLSEALLKEEIGYIMVSMHYTFLCTRYERPEFIQEAWEGARYFYFNCYIKNLPIDLTQSNSIYTRRIFSRAKHWQHFQTPNLKRFLTDLEKYDKCPPWYI